MQVKVNLEIKICFRRLALFLTDPDEGNRNAPLCPRDRERDDIFTDQTVRLQLPAHAFVTHDRIKDFIIGAGFIVVRIELLKNRVVVSLRREVTRAVIAL